MNADPQPQVNPEELHRLHRQLRLQRRLTSVFFILFWVFAAMPFLKEKIAGVSHETAFYVTGVMLMLLVWRLMVLLLQPARKNELNADPSALQ